MLDISIVIPSYNRPGIVAEAIARCEQLDPPPRELIIVDDHSDLPMDGESLKRPFVRYIRLPENGGQSVARSVGLATAAGKYIVSLDDDSWFVDRDALARIWARMEAMPRCGVLAFRTFSPNDPVREAIDRVTVVADHIACGAAFRADVLRQVGYHVQFLRMTGEENDLSLKTMGAGFSVLLDESVRVFHDFDPSRRSRQSMTRVRRYAVRNDLLQAWIYFPVDIAAALTVWRSWSHFAFGLRNGYVASTFAGYAAFLYRFPQALFHRRPIARAAVLEYLRLRRQGSARS